MQQFVAKLIRR